MNAGEPEAWGECIVCSRRQRTSPGGLLTARCEACGGELVGAQPSVVVTRRDAQLPPGVVAAPAAPPHGSEPPEVEQARADPRRRFGPYVLLAELGRGGMGVVHRAWHGGLRRHVALKLLLSQDEVGEEAIRRFYREAQAAARLRHPNIVAVHDVGEVDGKHYLAMELVEGTTLDKRLRSGGDLEGSIAAVRDVARAVQHAHEHGVIHRDLKPQNILVDGRGTPFVLDFGLARLRDGGAKLTRTGATMGTPAYMPPEQVGGGTEEVDARSDVYALGATLYHVLCGGPPFRGESMYAVMGAVISKPPPPPRSIDPQVPEELEAVCLRCLEKDPARRYPSAAAFADALDRYLARDPRAAPPARPRAIGRGPAAVLLLVPLAGVGLGLVLRWATGPEATPAPVTTPSSPATEAAPPPVKPPAPAAPDALAEAEALAQAGDVEGALRRLDDALRVRPDDGPVLANRGMRRAWLGRWDDAAADLSRALELGVDDGGLRRTRAWVLLQRGAREDLPQAQADLDRALSFDGKDAQAYLWRGVTRARRGDGAGGLSDLERSLELQPGDLLARRLRDEVAASLDR